MGNIWEIYRRYISEISCVTCPRFWRWQNNVKSCNCFIFIAKLILLAIQYLHEIDIIHRDIKPENILVEKDSNGRVSTVKLIDFGFSCQNETKNTLSVICGTPNYVAPEVINGGYDHRSDIFSVGVIVYQMQRGTLPFDAQIPDLIQNKTVRGDYQINDDHWDNISEDGKNLVASLLEKDPSKRMSISDAQKHPWIKNHRELKKYAGANSHPDNKQKDDFDHMGMNNGQ